MTAELAAAWAEMQRCDSVMMDLHLQEYPPWDECYEKMCVQVRGDIEGYLEILAGAQESEFEFDCVITFFSELASTEVDPMALGKALKIITRDLDKRAEFMIDNAKEEYEKNHGFQAI